MLSPNQAAPKMQALPAASNAGPFPPPLRRLFAAFVDLALLWFVTELLSVFYEDEFIALGRSGRLIGALFFLAYIGGQNSTFTNGRTLGKKLCRLRTVTEKGRALTLERSLVRAALLLLPFLTKGLFVFPAHPSVAFTLHVLLALASVGYGGVLLASYFFTKQTGQALHDRLLGTCVILQDANPPETLPPATGKHWQRTTAVVWLFLCATGAGAQWWWWGGSRWNQVVELRARVLGLDGVRRAEVFLGSFYFRSAAGTKEHARYLEVLAFFRHKVSDFAEESRRVAEAVVVSNPVDEWTAIRVTVGYEFDLLFARRRWQQSWVRTPAAWRDLVLPGKDQ
ncbi:hypothetical protein HRbin30_02748 [bacterium HR30]|nr:hypothetical protein HRbin30_02748 [bacterium HR30]